MERNFEYTELFSFAPPNESENLQIEFQPIANDVMLGYPSQNTVCRYSPTLDVSFMENETIHASALDSFLQWQDDFHINQYNLPFECIDNESVTELKRKSTDEILEAESKTGWNLGTTSDLKLVTNSWNNDYFSENIDGRFRSLSQFNFFDSEGKTSLPRETPVNNISDNEGENVVLNIKQFRPNFSVAGLKSSHSYISTEIAAEEQNFFTNTDNSNFESYCFEGISIKEVDIGNSKQKLIHSSEEQFENIKCQWNVSQVVHPSKRKHAHEKNTFECSVCELIFPYKAFSNQHMLKNTREQPFQCDICGKRFSRTRNFNVHLRIHTAEKSFHCIVCGKRYSRKRTLNDHMRIHTGEKPFQCSICKKKFVRSDILNKHMRIHTKQKPL